MTNDHHDVLKLAPLVFGHSNQTHKAFEEMGELQAALARYYVEPMRYVDVSPIIDEIADVAIMMHQLACIFGMPLVQERIQFKVDRLKQKLDH